MWRKRTPRDSFGRARAATALTFDDALTAKDDPRAHALHARLDDAARAEQRLRVEDLDRSWLIDDELAASWIATLPWAQATAGGTRPELVPSWHDGSDSFRRELLQRALDVEVGRRLPAVQQMRPGWELVRVPRWEVERLRALASDGGHLLAGDGLLYTARCRHGMLIPPQRGGRCALGCRVAEAFG